MNIQDLYSLFIKSTGVSTDTRKIEAGNIFFALKGENFNGNIYAQKALEEEQQDKIEKDNISYILYRLILT